MSFAAIVLGTPGWVLPLVIFSVASLLVLWWSYSRSAVDARVRWTAAALKALAITLLIMCLVEPLFSGTRPRPGANAFVVLADNSQSMQVRDRNARQTRAEILQEQLAENSPWQTRLGQDFDVRRYSFDSRLQLVRNFANLAMDGQGSAIAVALRNVAARYRDRPTAGVLLLTDGNATDRLEDIDWSIMPPVYPVVIGHDAPARDLSIQQVSVTQTNFEETPVTVQSEVVGQGYAGEDLAVQLVDDRERVVEEQKLEYQQDGEPVTVRFQLRPEKPGVSFYRVRVAAADEIEQFEEPERTREATVDNNQRFVVVDRGGGPYRVLYVSGRPNWEFKFLRRAIQMDNEVQLLGLVRMAKREPKFEFLGRAGESTNPLFRGFENQDDEEAEQYDQPVLLRLGIAEESELRDGFPQAKDELYGYHAIILDDVEAEFFKPDQLSLLQQFVSHRGGGFLMLGGQESFTKGNYTDTPIASLLPVYLDRPQDVTPSDGYRLRLTREGWLQPWVRLRSTEPEEETRLKSVPAFRTLNVVGQVKPGAAVLAEVSRADGTKLPALVAQNFGRGRSAALLIGDMWRWGLRRKPDEPKDMEKAWRQTVRWLVADVPKRVEVNIEQRREDSHLPVDLDVVVRDAEFEALDNAAVRVTVTPPTGQPVQLTAEAGERSGVYSTTFVPRQVGAYRADVVATAPDGSEIAKREVGFTAEPAADEFKRLQPNRDLLEEIAQRSGGEVLELDGLEEFVSSLPNRKVPVVEPWVYPLWHQPLVFLLAIGCLVAETGLRRWYGLA